MKYIHHEERIPKDQRKTLNDKVLYCHTAPEFSLPPWY